MQIFRRGRANWDAEILKICIIFKPLEFLEKALKAFFEDSRIILVSFLDN